MIISSIDIYNKKVVRLYKGNLNFIKYFGYFYEYYDFYNKLNIKKLHLVILDNIFKNVFLKIKVNRNIIIQIGGGINNKEKVNFLFKNGFSKFVLGSILFNNKLEFKKILSFYKKKIIISLDCYKKKIVIEGWKNKLKIYFNNIFFYLNDLNIKNIIYTNIEKDGTLEGFKNNEFFFLENKKHLCKFIISGGVKNIFNILKLKNKFSFIVGTSIYNFFIKISNLL